MFVYAVGILMAGLIAILAVNLHRNPAENTVARANAAAASFVTYRDAVVEYAQTHTTYTGTVGSSSLPLPPGYVSQYAWSNHLSNGLVLVWGTLPAGGLAAASADAQNSVTIGTAVMQGGNEVIVSPVDASTPVTIPTGIVPIGAAASAVQVN